MRVCVLPLTFQAVKQWNIIYRIGFLAFVYICVDAGMLSVCYSLGMCVWTLIAVLSECDSHTPRVLLGISGFRGDSSCVAVCNTQI